MKTRQIAASGQEISATTRMKPSAKGRSNSVARLAEPSAESICSGARSAPRRAASPSADPAPLRAVIRMPKAPVLSRSCSARPMRPAMPSRT
ncbi:hypothetical protein GAY28_28445 [Azospirillum brasilense]|nr:hypothetical protein [Azospirillum brasilense]